MGGFRMCWIQSGCGQLAVQVWSQREARAGRVCLSVCLSFPSFLLSFLPFFFFLGGRCISRFLKHNACLLRGTHQELAAFLPVDPHLSTSATLFGATHPAWAALGYAGLG